jgi:thioredoxin reductase (NADPH)
LACRASQKFKGFGVSACATCDGFFYRNKEVLVVGGGNTAVEEALFLTNFASKVTVVHRRDEFPRRAHPAGAPVQEPQDRSALEYRAGRCRWQRPCRHRCNSVALRNVITGHRTESIDVDGIFIAIGHAPSTSIFSGKLDMKPGGYLQVRPGTTETNIPGVFAAGDVTDDVYRQAVTAAGMGCMAALEAERYLAQHELAEAAE